MKRFLAIGLVIGLAACGGANDGNPNTDTTTTIPPDTSITNNIGTDTANNINTNTGTYTEDTTGNKNDVRSSSSAYPDGRGVKKDSSRQ